MPPTHSRPFRFIYTDANDGYMNMAIDEAVMIGLKRCNSTPVLRIYKWKPPTITIGYFQNASDINFEKCKTDGIRVVRRLTGGRAVLHFEELTYSILFTEEDFFPFKKRELFTFIARCLMDSLNFLGIGSKITEKTRGSLKSPNCFASPAQYEIESMEEGKLIGSAQVIKDGIVLQHGAIPLTDSYSKIAKYLNCNGPSFKSTSSLNQVSRFKVQENKLLNALKSGFGKHLTLKDSRLTARESKTADRLKLEKYASVEWMFRK
jgi:lipoate-protein ligase A